MYVCPTSAHRGFRYGYRPYKDNTFILETTWFGRKSMILRFGLTLFNINMSKKFTLSCFFLQKSLSYQSHKPMLYKGITNISVLLLFL